jgi:hypothetical protein
MWSSRSTVHGAPCGRGWRFAASVAVTAGLATGGCTASYVEDSNAPVLLRIVQVNGGNPLDSDVRLAPSAVQDDVVNVSLAVRSKNLNVTVPQITMAIFVERYEVSYYRSDGRGVQGVDIPYTISGNLTQVIDAATSGSVDVPMTVVRSQAKLEPPLINLWGDSDGILGGTALKVTMFAKITVHGSTIAGQAVETTGALEIHFADFPSTNATPASRSSRTGS